MSLFPSHDLSLNRYYYTFYSYHPNTPNVLNCLVYDQDQNLVETQDISFNGKTMNEMMALVENSNANPYAIGKAGTDYRSMDLTFGTVYKKSFQEKQRQKLMTYLNSNYKNVHGTSRSVFTITASGGKYYVGGYTDAAPDLFAPKEGYYVFDQSDSTNVSHPLVLSTQDGSSTYYSSMFTEGTRGSLNGYTIVDISAGTPDLYYYCTAHSGMGGQLLNFASAVPYTVSVVYNDRYGHDIYQVAELANYYTDASGIYLNTGSKYAIDLSVLNGTSFNPIVGTTNDISSSIISDTSIVNQVGDILYVRPLLSNLYLFDQTVALMTKPLENGYYVKTIQNWTGTSVFTLMEPTESTGIVQRDLSFNAGDVVLFQVGHSSMDNFNLVFGTTVDDVATALGNNYVSQNGDIITLDLSSYSGGAVYYFEDSSANMGYVEAPENTTTTNITTPHTVIDPPLSVRGFSESYTGFTDSRLASTSSWATSQSYKYGEWMYIGNETNGDIGIVGVKIMPRASGEQHIIKFTAEYSSDNINYYDVDGGYEFSTNFSTASPYNNNQVSLNYFTTPVLAQYIRITPTEAYNWISMRAGLIQGTSTTTTTTTINTYPVTVFNGVFVIDGVSKDNITFTNGKTYVFDQSDSTNAGFPIVFGTSPESSSFYNTGVTVVGTPGQAGSYTRIDYNDTTGALYYYNNIIPGMGYDNLNTISYHVTVSDTPPKFYLNSALQVVTFTANTKYYFYQYDSTNENYPIVFDETADDAAPYFTDGVTTVGTPGQSGAYTILDLSAGFTGPLVYFSNGATDMGSFETYTVKVVQNWAGNNVFSIQVPGEDFSYNQPDLSFNAGDNVFFDVGDSSMTGYTLVFGTEIDNSGTSLGSPYVTDLGTLIGLNLPSDYTGGAVYYFENTNAGMGYVEAPGLISTTNTTNINPPNSSRYHSSVYTGLTADSTYDSTSSWIAGADSASKLGTADAVYMTIDCGSDIGIVGLRIQGRSNPSNNPNYTNHYVAKLTVEYSSDGTTYNDVDNGAEFDATSTLGYADFNFATPVLARYIKITPTAIQESNGFIAMRAGLIEGAVTAFNSYTVTVSNGVFFIDGVSKPEITFTDGESYVFDQSDSTNAGYPIVFGTTADNMSNLYTTGVTVVGTPGQAGAYTRIDYTGSTTLFYFSSGATYMGYIETYTVTVVQNWLGNNVFSIQAPNEDFSYNQPDLSFNAGDTFLFDVTDSSMTGYTLVFGTEIDVSSTILSSPYVSNLGTLIGLNLPSNYTGGAVYYFENTNTGMGYVEAPVTANTYTVVVSYGDFYINTGSGSVKRPEITFTDGQTYVFDQSDSTNTGYPIVFGETRDSTPYYTNGVTVVGTPGQPGAYTRFDYTGSTALFYFSIGSTGMGYRPLNSDVTNQLSYHTNATNNNISGSSFTNLVNSSLNGTIYGTVDYPYPVTYETNIGGRPCYLVPRYVSPSAISLPAGLPTNSCTFSAYFYRTLDTNHSWTTLVGFNTSAYHNVITGSASFVHYTAKNLAVRNASNSSIYTGNQIPGYDEWIHFCITYYNNGSSSSGNIYINGVKETTYSNSTLDIQQYILGGYGNLSNPGKYAGFYLNDVRIYNKVLSDSEVSSLYDYISY